jgi:hypothetical protein
LPEGKGFGRRLEQSNIPNVRRPKSLTLGLCRIVNKNCSHELAQSRSIKIETRDGLFLDFPQVELSLYAFYLSLRNYHVAAL